MSPLKFKTTPAPFGLRVAIEGDAGVADLERLEVELGKIGDEVKGKMVGVDLSKMTFISSAGMGAFIKLRSSLLKKGISVRFGGARPEIFEAFRRSKLDKLLEFVDAV